MVSLNTPNPSESSGTTVAHDAFLSGAKREDVPNARVVSVAQPAPGEFGVGIMSDLIFKLTVNQLCSVIRQRGVDRESETMLGMLKIDGVPQHLALITDYPMPGEMGMIHAYAPARKVVEHRYDPQWRRQTYAAYRILQPSAKV